MSDQPLVSVIINCFNGEKYLQKAIDSVISQTYKNWEIIFFDNRSSDASVEIFKKYKDDRLKYYLASTHIEILYKARNYALEKASGEFFAFLDVDDWWHSQKLEKQIPSFKDPKVGLVYGNLWQVFEKKNKRKLYRKKLLPKGMILNDLLDDYLIGSPTYVIRKKALNGLKYYFNDKFHIIGDFDLNIRLSCDWKIDCIQEPVAFVRIHGKNISLLNRDKEINELKIWYEEMRNNPVFNSQSKFNQISLMISYLKTMQTILENGFKKSFMMVLKYPISIKKIKLLIALLLPKFILKKIKNY